MDIRKVKKLIELLDESGIAEIEITEGEESVRISRHGSGVAAAPVAAAPRSLLLRRQPRLYQQRPPQCRRRWWKSRMTALP